MARNPARLPGLYDLLFSLGLALLLTHELDAMTHAEWRILPMLAWMQDNAGRFYFVLLHVPVFALIIWFVSSMQPVTRWWAQAGIDAFLIIHSGLHVFFSGHAEYSFSGPLSLSLIFAAALLGLLHLAILLRNRPANPADSG